MLDQAPVMLAFKHPEALFSVLKITSDHSLWMTDVLCKGHLQLPGGIAGASSHFASLGLQWGQCLCPAGRQTVWLPFQQLSLGGGLGLWGFTDSQTGHRGGVLWMEASGLCHLPKQLLGV